jgi:hypothetical protein
MLLNYAGKALMAMLGANTGSTVTYTRGGDEVELTATVGESAWDVADGNGMLTTFASRDYIVDADDLTIGLPERGDKITDGDDVYEVLAPGRQDVYRLHHGVLRIHTKKVGS